MGMTRLFTIETKRYLGPIIMNSWTDKNSGKEHVSIFMPDDTTLSEILNINNPETQPVSNIQAIVERINVERISKFSREENMNLKKTIQK